MRERDKPWQGAAILEGQEEKSGMIRMDAVDEVDEARHSSRGPRNQTPQTNVSQGITEGEDRLCTIEQGQETRDRCYWELGALPKRVADGTEVLRY